MRFTFYKRRIAKGTSVASATGSGTAYFGQTDASPKIRQRKAPKQASDNFEAIGTK